MTCELLWGFKDVFNMHLLGAVVNHRQETMQRCAADIKKRPAGRFIVCGTRSGLAAKQIAFFRFERLSNDHQDGDQQIGSKNTDQPLRHLQRQELPLTH